MDERQFGPWRKSTRSGGADNCVEVATGPDRQIGVRDSKNADGGILVFTPGEWAAFVEGVRNGEFDL
ncbi:DUF397 domain-containing protein [Catellatospora bangladeshensis]|uniref:DUF397 domain-containing protein n=1 Tax=Catellatospora bangladeshensis TaxID=310355 RepID=A0A8J3JHQ6_9ACTN|nr:DUF397 domain-containing protein [Catellatospora bangladeshensis]GIF80881.1 hypothetical protein Cba03nite_22300 [Catellatospora bangladeshensis]